MHSNEKLQMALFDPPGLDGHDSLRVCSWTCWIENQLRIRILCGLED